MNTYFNKIIILIIFVLYTPLHPYTYYRSINLNELNEDFILETKRIQVSRYPHIFNPSIVKWKNSLLMAFRIHDNKAISAKPIGLVWLDENFNAKGHPYLLKIRNQKKYTSFVNKRSPLREQDPRLIVINNRLYMVYSNFQIGRVFVAEVHYDETGFFLDNPEGLFHFDNANKHRIEKNWVPFEYHNNLLLAYSISPHTVLLPQPGTESCITYAHSLKQIPWSWGEIRGGTPAILIDGKYLSFFHSSMDITNTRSKHKKIRYYFMGAYLFEPNPPFNITHVSPNPIVYNDFYKGKRYRTWKPLHVIFPAGIIDNKDYIWVSYGKQDHECWVVKFDKKKLLNSLQPI